VTLTLTLSALEFSRDTLLCEAGRWTTRQHPRVKYGPVGQPVEMTEQEVYENMARALRELDEAQKRVDALRVVLTQFQIGPTGCVLLPPEL